jgi:peptide/nickel transport system substrate-binding protein
MTTKASGPARGSEGLFPEPSRRAFLTLAGAAGGILLVGCSTASSTSSTGSTTGSGSGAPVKGGTLKMAFLGSIESLDPHENSSFAGTNYSNNIVDRLTFQNRDTGEITPWLAESWQNNADFTEWTFNLRNDVTFSDGTKFTATSVKNNLDQFVNGDTALSILPYGATYLGGYKETQVVSEYVAKVVFATPTASFLQLTAHSGTGNIAFLADKTLKSSASERLKPENMISTGPFVVTDYVPNEQTIIVRRGDYNWAPKAFGHSGPAYLDKIVYLTVPDASVRVGSLESGNVQATYDIIPTDEKVLTAAGYDLTSRVVPGFTLAWQFNLSLPQTADINVRRAIIAATNRPEFKKYLLSPSEGEALSVITRNTPGFADFSTTALKYDLDQAKSLLESAGWKVGAGGIREKNGVKLNLKGGSNILLPDSQVAMTALQATLKTIGINVDIVFNTTNIPQTTINQDYHLIEINRARDDAVVLDTQLNPTLGNGCQIPSDFPGRAKIAKTLNALNSTSDPATLLSLAKAAQQTILEEYALVNPIFETSQVAATKVVRDIYEDACTRLLFLGTWISGS